MLDGVGANGGHPLLVQATQPGALGRLDWDRPNTLTSISHGQLLAHLGGTGMETLVVKSTNHDDNGGVHVRFLQKIHGIVVEGASIVVHGKADGTITAVNGELVPVEAGMAEMVALMINGQTTSALAKDALPLLERARKESGVDGGRWADDKPLLAVVRRPLDGSACLAWKRVYKYSVGKPDSEKTIPQADLLFADASGSAERRGDQGSVFQGVVEAAGESTSGKMYPALCASHPMIMGSGIPNMKTYDCQGSYGDNCVLMSDSSTPIYHEDLDVSLAHNFAWAT